MMKTSPKPLVIAGDWLWLTLLVLLGLTAPTNRGSTLDDFDGATKTGWADFTFQAGFGIPIQTNGQFRFEQPPAGQAIFSDSQKDSQIPGASTELGNENYAMEVRAFLQLPAGVTRLGVRCDDDYKLASASTLMQLLTVKINGDQVVITYKQN